MGIQRSKRMQLIVDLALKAESQAAKNLSEAQKVHAAEKRRLEDIEHYYTSYEKNFSARSTSLRASELAGSRGFLANLNQAQQQQQQQVIHAESQVEQARSLWRQSHLKSDSLEDFQQRCRHDEQSIVNKREQAFMDDLSSRSSTHFP